MEGESIAVRMDSCFFISKFKGGLMDRKMENFVVPLNLCRKGQVKNNFKNSQFVWVVSNPLASLDPKNNFELMPRYSAPTTKDYDVDEVLPAPLAEEILIDASEKLHKLSDDFPEMEGFIERRMAGLAEIYGSRYNLSLERPVENLFKEYVRILVFIKGISTCGK